MRNFLIIILFFAQPTWAAVRCDVVKQAAQALRSQAASATDIRQTKGPSYQSVASYVEILRQYGGSCPKLLTLDEQDDSLFVKYQDGVVKADVFKFGADGSIISWLHKPNNSEEKVLEY